MISIATALLVLNDPEGFFPDEWKQQANEVIEQKGTEEQKKKIGSGGINIVRGNLTEGLGSGNLSNILQ